MPPCFKIRSSVLVMPGIFQSEDAAQSNLPIALQKWLRHSQRSSVSHSFYELMMGLFGYEEGQHYNLASLRATQEGLNDGGQILCADPIRVAVDVAHVYSLGNAYLALSMTEAQDYIHYLNAQLSCYGWLEIAQSPLQWYFRVKQPNLQAAMPPDLIFGKTLTDKLPRDGSHLALLALFNEVQMLLHHCDLNKRRQAQGRATLDALWFWGAGKPIIKNSRCSWDFVLSNNDIVLALARLNQVESCRLPKQQLQVSSLKQYKRILIVDDHYQFKDASDKTFYPILETYLPFLDQLYVGDGYCYTRRNTLGKMIRSFVN